MRNLDTHEQFTTSYVSRGRTEKVRDLDDTKTLDIYSIYTRFVGYLR